MKRKTAARLIPGDTYFDHKGDVITVDGAMTLGLPKCNADFLRRRKLTPATRDAIRERKAAAKLSDMGITPEIIAGLETALRVAARVGDALSRAAAKAQQPEPSCVKCNRINGPLNEFMRCADCAQQPAEQPTIPAWCVPSVRIQHRGSKQYAGIVKSVETNGAVITDGPHTWIGVVLLPDYEPAEQPLRQAMHPATWPCAVCGRNREIPQGGTCDDCAGQPLQVGDSVETLARAKGAGRKGFPIGTVGVIEDGDPSGFKVAANDDYWYYPAASLRRIVPPEQPAPEPSLQERIHVAANYLPGESGNMRAARLGRAIRAAAATERFPILRSSYNAGIDAALTNLLAALEGGK